MLSIARDSIVAQHPKKFALAWAGLFCFALMVVITLLDIGADHPIIDEFKAQVQYRLIAPVADAFKNGVLRSELLPILVMVFILQFIIPARPEEKIWSWNLFADFICLFTTALQHAFLVAIYVSYLAAAHMNQLGGFTLFRPDELPIWAQAAIAIILYDFLRYVQHALMHKVPLLWQFHTVHHAQRQMTIFTNYRTHAVELFAELTMTAIPFLILGFSMPVIVGVTLFVNYWPQLYHANLKLNLGPLHYILVTPQYHRIHHSLAAEHMDKNLARIFSFWDALFGTRVWDTKLYPTTGIPDPDFPAALPSSPLVALALPIVQILYPFEAIWNRYIRRSKSAYFAGSSAE